MRKMIGALGAACIAVVAAGTANAANVGVTVNSADPYIGYMNVSNLPASMGGDGAYQFGSSWGTQDLRATFTGNVLKLQANNIGDPSTYWYQDGGAPGHAGNKIMDASMYVDSPAGVANGDKVTFSGIVLQNTFVAPYTSVAFIKDFAPDYSSYNVSTVALTPGAFSTTLQTDPTSGRHIQFGFETVGPDAWITDADAKGFVTVTAAAVSPEPTTLAVAGAAGSLLLRRRRA